MKTIFLVHYDNGEQYGELHSHDIVAVYSDRYKAVEFIKSQGYDETGRADLDTLHDAKNIVGASPIYGRSAKFGDAMETMQVEEWRICE